jgi:hypothetical protein
MPDHMSEPAPKVLITCPKSGAPSPVSHEQVPANNDAEALAEVWLRGGAQWCPLFAGLLLRPLGGFWVFALQPTVTVARCSCFVPGFHGISSIAALGAVFHDRSEVEQIAVEAKTTEDDEFEENDSPDADVSDGANFDE